jgi:hypothetical protein
MSALTLNPVLARFWRRNRSFSCIQYMNTQGDCRVECISFVSPLKRLVTAVLKYTKRRRSAQSSVLGTSSGCTLLAWSANTCHQIIEFSKDVAFLSWNLVICLSVMRKIDRTWFWKLLYLVNLKVSSIQWKPSLHCCSAWYLFAQTNDFQCS